MKKISVWFLSTVIVVCSLALTSCLNGDNKIYYRGYITVNDYLGLKEFVWDFSDIVLVPEYAYMSLFDNVERAYIYFSVDEETVASSNTKWDIEFISGMSITTKSLCTQPDTLRNDSLISFNYIWADKGYVNTITDFYIDADKKDYYMDMVREGISNDTLYLRLNLNTSENSKTELQDAHHSFRLPGKYELENAGITAINDSIVITVNAKVQSGSASKTVPLSTKYKLY